MIGAVQCIIECDKCGNKIGGYGAGECEVADEAMASGWHITKGEAVYCPTCRIRRVPTETVADNSAKIKEK